KTELLKSSKFEDLLVLSTPSTPSLDSTVTGNLIITSQNEEKIIQNLIDKLPYNNILDTNKYINIDNLYRSVDLTNEEIIDIIQDNSSEIVEEPVTIESAISSINNVLQFIKQNSELKIDNNEKKLLYTIQQKFNNLNK
ncbi:27975_t:CDS:1, partial [Racocetra persica]